MSLPHLGGLFTRQVIRNERLPNLCMAFSTCSISQAQKKTAKKPAPKRKTPMRKAPGGKGPKSTKRASGSDSSSSVSRTNAFLEPQRKMLHLEELVPENAIPEKLCKPMAWTPRTLEATRIQGFGLTRELARKFKQTPRPRSVLRQSSLDLFDLLDKSSKSASTSSDNTLLRGSIGVGISTLMLQCVSYALESSWIVIYVPRAINLVDSSSPYTYSESLQTYLQPDVARGMLERILAVNRNELAKLSIHKEVTLDKGLIIENGLELTRAIELGLGRDTSAAATQQILELVMKTISQQDDIPVLMAIDGVQALFSTTKYRDPDYRQLQSYELAVPRLLQACLRKAGPGSLGGNRRGASLSAFSLQHKEWPISLEMRTALQLDEVDAYAKLDEIMLGIIEECRFSPMDITPSLSLTEGISIYDLAREEGGMWTQHNDEILMSKITESGGNIGVFERSLRRSVI